MLSSKNLISVVMKLLSKSKILILIFATLSMLGCSTGYYPSESFGGYGYSEMKLAEATYIVRFRGNGATQQWPKPSSISTKSC